MMATASLGSTSWQFLLLFLAVTASWAGLPAVGSVALGAAAVAATQQRLDLAAVIVVSVIDGEAGGISGYAVGRRWGRRLLEHPGRHQAPAEDNAAGRAVVCPMGALAGRARDAAAHAPPWPCVRT
jgi:membrane protein DedA with SNARE-associated domain